MKNSFKLSLFLLALLPLSILNAFQRRANARTAGGIFRSYNTSSGKTIATSRTTTPIYCSKGARSYYIPKPAYVLSRIPGAETGIKAAARHGGKLLAAGAAGGVYGIGTSLSESGKKHNQIKSDLHEFHELLWGGSVDNNDTREALDTIIERLEENGGINKKNENGNTPLMMVIAAAKLSNNEKKEIFKALLAHGARPGEGELASALNIPSVHYLQDLSWDHISSPHLTALKTLLPYYSHETLTSLVKNLNNKIIPLINERNNLKKAYEQKSSYYSTVKKDDLDIKIQTLTQVITIANKSLYEGKLSGKVFYKEIDETITR